MLKPFLFLAYFLALTPVALIRRALGYDPMALKQWKKGTRSVFVDRNHVYTSKDMDTPS